ncbi:hypothetical protein SCLCIDRAFT_1214948 [Scleroderma citrinum Foug A]|uniref:Uncharacterized protein n=1 Tax=Scleroderma citrinum Foug A TaxID=1036808 RepID=A0A0C2ZM21_9AGAM|nr:hypothetical protein SCLCIDRAFT_1214948 [Scleroderma citrinum Foug A]
MDARACLEKHRKNYMKLLYLWFTRVRGYRSENLFNAAHRPIARISDFGDNETKQDTIPLAIVHLEIPCVQATLLVLYWVQLCAQTTCRYALLRVTAAYAGFARRKPGERPPSWIEC